jgi:chorismate dehydratase
MLEGLQKDPIASEITLQLHYPAGLAGMLKQGEIDIALLPVGVLPELGNYKILSDVCIGTIGEVASVAVFSQVDMEMIETVVLDYQSRTSVLLCRILFEKLWKKSVKFIPATDESYIEQIQGTTAALIIGDRALSYRDQVKHVFDLGKGWQELTGLPFVFAVWVATKPLENDFVKRFAKAVQEGTGKLRQIANRVDFSDYDLYTYFTENISYSFDDAKREGLQRFLEEIVGR